MGSIRLKWGAGQMSNYINIKTREAASSYDMDISRVNNGVAMIEAESRQENNKQYTRVMINKDDAQRIVSHLKEQFSL
jgi:hypothetical protein